MAERITDEQAIKIAEWLGRYYEVHDIVLIENNRGKLTSCKEWLYTAEAERALMNKLGESELKLIVCPPTVQCNFYQIDFATNCLFGRGKTRIAALHNAVLELTGGWE